MGVKKSEEERRMSFVMHGCHRDDFGEMERCERCRRDGERWRDARDGGRDGGSLSERKAGKADKAEGKGKADKAEGKADKAEEERMT